MFSQGHEDRFTVYVHASKEAPAHVSRYFIGRNIRSEKVMSLLECCLLIGQMIII